MPVQSPRRPTSSAVKSSMRSASTMKVNSSTAAVTSRISLRSVTIACSRLLSPMAYTITVQVPSAGTSPAAGGVTVVVVVVVGPVVWVTVVLVVEVEPAMVVTVVPGPPAVVRSSDDLCSR